MYKVNTPDGDKFLVQLVGPASYRMGPQITYRGGTLTVTKRTRDYLVRKTAGAWADFDPTPQEPIQEILPPQFGEPGGPMIDMDDIDPMANPSLTMEQAHQLANSHGGMEVHEFSNSPDPEDLAQTPTPAAPAKSESGDMTGADLKAGQKVQGGGGKTAAKAAPAKAGNVKIGKPPAPAKAVEATEVT